MSVKKKSLILIGFAIILCLGGYLFFQILFYDSYQARSFDSEKWKIDKNKRIELVDDLIQTKVLDSLTHTEIINLLGKPEKEPSYFKQSGRDLIYHLGPQRTGFVSVDSEWLLIWLKEGDINKYEIWTD